MRALEGLESIPASHPRLGLRLFVEGDPPVAVRISLSGAIENEAGLAVLRQTENALRDLVSLRRLELDLSLVRYASSTGIGSIAAIHLAAVARGVEVLILSPSAQVSMLFGLLGFESFLSIRREEGGTAP